MTIILSYNKINYKYTIILKGYLKTSFDSWKEKQIRIMCIHVLPLSIKEDCKRIFGRYTVSFGKFVPLQQKLCRALKVVWRDGSIANYACRENQGLIFRSPKDHMTFISKFQYLSDPTYHLQNEHSSNWVTGVIFFIS